MDAAFMEGNLEKPLLIAKVVKMLFLLNVVHMLLPKNSFFRNIINDTRIVQNYM